MKNSSTAFSSRAYAGVIIITTLVFLALCEYAMRSYVLNNFDHLVTVREATFETKPMAVLGDSHMRSAFYNDSVAYVNFSQGKMSPQAMEAILSEYMTRTELKQVVLEASFQTFSLARERIGTWHFDELFADNPFDNSNPFRLYLFDKNIRIGLDFMWRDYKKQRKKKKTEAAPSWAEISEQKRLQRTQRRFQRQRPMSDFRRSQAYAAYVRMLEALREKSVTICMLRTPLSRNYELLIADDPLVAQAYAEQRRLAGEYGARYVDARELNMSYVDQFFADQDHLNGEGRDIFEPLAMRACGFR